MRAPPAAAERISIHALREEGDRLGLRPRHCAQYFYPRPPRGGRLQAGQGVQAKAKFLSTPSARRATRAHFAMLFSARYFYPRPPRGGRPARGKLRACGRGISIHALREEGDSYLAGVAAQQAHFYPRPPRGGRRQALTGQKWTPEFLSTPSARRATYVCMVP